MEAAKGVARDTESVLMTLLGEGMDLAVSDLKKTGRLPIQVIGFKTLPDGTEGAVYLIDGGSSREKFWLMVKVALVAEEIERYIVVSETFSIKANPGDPRPVDFASDPRSVDAVAVVASVPGRAYMETAEIVREDGRFVGLKNHFVTREATGRMTTLLLPRKPPADLVRLAKEALKRAGELGDAVDVSEKVN